MTSAKMIARLLIILSAFILIFPVTAQDDTLTDEETAVIDLVTQAIDELVTAQSYRYRVIERIDLDLAVILSGTSFNLSLNENTDVSGAYTSVNGVNRIAVRGTYEESSDLSDIGEQVNAGSIDFEMVVIDEDLYLLVTGSDGTIDIPRFVPDGWFLLTQDFPLITELTIRPTGMDITNFNLESALSIIQRDTILIDDDLAVIPYTFEFGASDLPAEQLDILLQDLNDDNFDGLLDGLIDSLLENLRIKVSVLLHEESGDLYAISIAFDGQFSFESDVDGTILPVDMALNTVQNSWYRDLNDSITIIAPSVSGN